MSKTDTPAKVASNDQLGLLQITRHDHPEPQTMVWSELELHAIRAYAGRCVAAERERCAKLCDELRLITDDDSGATNALLWAAEAIRA